jgi:hypothetical protein
MKPLLLTAGVAVAAAAAAVSAASSFSLTSATRSRAPCPSSVKALPSARAPEGLVGAVRREVPRNYVITNQSGRVRLTPKHYLMDSILRLTPSFPESKDARLYRGIAKKRCGTGVANRSWIVLVRFPEAQSIPASYGVMFFAETTRGWRMWWKYH